MHRINSYKIIFLITLGAIVASALLLPRICLSDEYSDSLKNELSLAKIDTVRAEILWKMCHISAVIDSSKAMDYGNQALSLSKRLKSDFHIARSLYEIGFVKISHHENDEARLLWEESLKYMEKTGYKNQVGIILSELGRANWRTGSLKTSMDFYTKACNIYKETGNNDRMATSLISMGNCLKDIGEYSKALEKYHEAHNILTELKDTSGIASATNNIGLIYWKTGKLSQAIEKFHEALELRELTNDTYGIASCYTNIGVIHYTQKNYAQSIEYWKKGLEIWEEMNYKPGLEETYNNIGAVYAELNNFEMSLAYLNKSLEIKIETGNRYGQSMALTNIGSIYMEKGDLDQALAYHEKALKIATEINSKNSIASAYSNMGTIYAMKGINKLAIRYFSKSLDITIKTDDKQQLLETYEAMSEAYESDKDFQNAYTYYKLYTDIKDSLFDIEKTEKITGLQAEYENEKKEKEIDLLNKEKRLQETELANKELEIKQQTTQKWMLFGGLFFILVIVIFVFRSLSQKKKTNARLAEQNRQIEEKNKTLQIVNQEINQRNEEISSQADYLELVNKQLEKSNRMITDSLRYAERIQKAILPDDDVIKKYLPESFVFYKPRDIVSGDFYWFSAIEDNLTKEVSKLFIAISDCTGHGVPGGFMSMIGNTLLDEIINKNQVYSPATILEMLNNGIIKALQQKKGSLDSQADGMDITICCIDKSVNAITIASANQSAYLVNNKEIKLITGDIFSIGGMFGYHPNLKYTNQSFQLKPGSRVYMFTDGFIDQFGENSNEKFQAKRIEQIISENFLTPVSQQGDIIENEFEKWKGSNDQIDDVLMFGFEVS